ncbi:ATP-binding protein [Breoghania sp.]|uniref:sensor histidine kinase n=1 Tax=Breoghania sp. TaxID=2065378 RepID=UPI002AA91E30|nr:ATP-binding protein [Breoghania sp.]
MDFPVTDGHGRNCWAQWGLKGRFDSLGELIDVVAIGRVISEELRYRNALEDLMRISNDVGKSQEERARMILAVGVKYFDADLAGITRLEGDQANPLVLNFHLDHLRERHAFPRERSYVDLVLRAGPVVAIHDIRETEYVTYPFYENLPLQSVIASEIYVGDRFYGIINFGTLKPRKAPFSDKQIQFCRLIARWLGYTLEQHFFYVGLQVSAERYHRIFQRAPTMMAVVDKQGHLLDVNATWLDRLGYSLSEVTGRDLADFFTPQSREALKAEPLDRQPLTIATQNLDFVTRDGVIFATQLSSLAVSAEDLPVLCVWVDMSERNRLREEMNAANRAIMRANEDLKRFNTVAAHDLQEPLRKIRLYGDQLDKHLPENSDPEARHALEVVTRAAERLSRLVRDLLAFSRESERGYANDPVDLEPLIGEAVGDMALLIRETGATVTIGALPQVTGDAVPLQRVFHNLILNALKYRHPDRSPKVEVLARVSAQGAREIVVRDNGIGLPEGSEEEVFEPFVRLHAARTTGIGIGLALVRSIVEGHGWTVTAHRREDHQGTEFIIRTNTPAAPATNADEATAPGKDRTS